MARNPQIGSNYSHSVDAADYLPVDDLYEMVKRNIKAKVENSQDPEDEYFEKDTPDLSNHPIFGNRK